MGLTDDPLALTQRLLSHSSEPSIGHDQESLEILEAAADRMVGVTQRNRMDDSVSAVRYRLEFVAENQRWRLTWMGSQFSCAPNRGRKSWHGQLCS